MTQEPKIIDVEEEAAPKDRRRRGDGGTYLVVADDTEEFNVALRYAARRAEANRAHVGIMHIIDVEDFQHWETVEAMMRKELRAQAEKYIWGVAKKINDLTGHCPSLYLAEGLRTDVLVETINNDARIVELVLGGGVAAAGPGPLVSYFTGKGLGRLRVPVLIVPGHLEPQKIDAIT